MSDPAQKYRLVTRSDFDGLVCAVLLKHLNLIDDIKFVHPKDMQDGKIVLGPTDITTNLPYVDGVYICFDHHHSETLRNPNRKPNHIIEGNAPSAARVVYNYYGGDKAFPPQWEEMMEAVDKADSAQFSKHDVLEPKGWVLLSFLMDARTGLGRFRDFRISNYELMMELIEHCKTKSIHDILELPDVKERVELYFEHEVPFKEQVGRCASTRDNVIILDLRGEDTIYVSNRFTIYAMFPHCSVSMHVLRGLANQNTVFAVGKSIINRSCPVNIGELMLEYEGGGHENAGTCQVENQDAEKVCESLVERLSKETAGTAVSA